jgi:hypothetical protein
MHHPTNRAERRHHRDRVIAARRFVYEHIWNNYGYNCITYDEFIKDISNPLMDINYLIEEMRSNDKLLDFPKWIMQWGKYAKYNLACSCRNCRSGNRYKKENVKRRRDLKMSCKNWEKEY